MQKVIITSPSLNPKENVSGVSSVARFIIDNNPNYKYLHFELGKRIKKRWLASNYEINWIIF